MDREEEIGLLKRVFEHVENGSTDCAPEPMALDASSYFDAGHAERERAIIARTPMAVAHRNEFAQPGDFVALTVLGLEVLLVRQDNGSARAFVNTCRHRGARVTSKGCGNTRMFSCPYHGWTYQRDGSLRVVPFAEGFDADVKSQRPLLSVPCTEVDGLVWIVPSIGGADLDLDEYLGPEAARSLHWLGVEDHVLYRRQTWELDVHWKLIADGFMEVYHLDFLHPSTIAPVMRSNLLVFDQLGPHARVVSARHDVTKLLDVPVESWELLRHSIVTHFFFPATVLATPRDHFEIWNVLPDLHDPGKCTVTLQFFIPEAATTEKSQSYWERNWDIMMRTVTSEDWLMASHIQASYRRGRTTDYVAGRNEIALQAFHRYLNAAVAEVADRGDLGAPWLRPAGQGVDVRRP